MRTLWKGWWVNGKKGSVRGQKFISGWGIHKTAPGFYPDPNGSIVEGLIFSSNDLVNYWTRLDAFEGPVMNVWRLKQRWGRAKISPLIFTGQSPATRRLFQ